MEGWGWGWRLCLGGGRQNRINFVHWNIITQFKGINTHFHLLKKWQFAYFVNMEHFCHTNTYHLKVSNTFSKSNHTVNQNTKSLAMTPTSFLKETCPLACPDCKRLSLLWNVMGWRKCIAHFIFAYMHWSTFDPHNGKLENSLRWQEPAFWLPLCSLWNAITVHIHLGPVSI